MSEDVMLSGRIPEELKDLVDADSRNNQEVLRAALWREFGGERKSDLERRIEEKENRISVIERERNERNREIERERNELEALKAKLETVESADELLEDEYDAILDDMEADGVHVWPNSQPVGQLVSEHDGGPNDIVEDLKHRAAEQDRDILHTQFRRADMVRGTKGRNIGEVLGDE